MLDNPDFDEVVAIFRPHILAALAEGVTVDMVGVRISPRVHIFPCAGGGHFELRDWSYCLYSLAAFANDSQIGEAIWYARELDAGMPAEPSLN